ncbi:MAG: hypothetical protein IIC13_09660 [SAR324 cluster bacterium]|nr:hypothetical protein [SAR324 cluster bacterium]MCH8886842.1 hypothetical protein [SAR324 cluster bacterium]
MKTFSTGGRMAPHGRNGHQVPQKGSVFIGVYRRFPILSGLVSPAAQRIGQCGIIIPNNNQP